MSTEQSSGKEMGALSRIVGVFTSPRETFESIDRKPTWLVPFLFLAILAIILSILVMDIVGEHQMKVLEARELPAAQMEAARARMEGPLRYVNLLFIPVMYLLVWVIISFVFWFSGNTILGGDIKFKKVFSVIAWSGLVSDWQGIGSVLKTLLIKMKGSVQGVQTSLAMILPTPEIGKPSTVMYRLLSRFDIFMIWQLVLWIIAFSVIYRFSIKKSTTLVLSVWIIWILIAVGLGGFLSTFGV